MPRRYGIEAIPRLLFFKEGRMVDRISGMTARDRIEERIQNLLAGKAPRQPFVVG